MGLCREMYQLRTLSPVAQCVEQKTLLPGLHIKRWLSFPLARVKDSYI